MIHPLSKRKIKLILCSFVPHWSLDQYAVENNLVWTYEEENFFYMVKCTILIIFKCTFQGHSVHPHYCATITTVHNSFYLHKLKLYTHWNSELPILSPPGPWQLPFYFLPLRISLCYACRIRRTIQYLSFSDWLILLRIMSSRFIHVVASVRISFLLTFHCMSIPRFAYPFIPWGALVLFLPFGSCEQCY